MKKGRLGREGGLGGKDDDPEMKFGMKGEKKFGKKNPQTKKTGFEGKDLSVKKGRLGRADGLGGKDDDLEKKGEMKFGKKGGRRLGRSLGRKFLWRRRRSIGERTFR